MRKIKKAVNGFFRFFELFLYAYHTHGGRRGRPLFNLHIKRVYDGVGRTTDLWPLGFESAVEAYYDAICVAKNLIGEEVWVDDEGCLWQGYRRGLPLRCATINVADQRGRLANFLKAFMKDESLEEYGRAPHIHIESDQGEGLPPERMYNIFLSHGQRPYLLEVYRAAVESRFGKAPAQRFLPARMV